MHQDSASQSNNLSKKFSKSRTNLTGPPNILIIAPSDPCCGAGIFQDIRTIEHSQEAYPLGIVSGISYQNANQFFGIDWLSWESIKKQLDSIIGTHDFEVTKIGLIPNFSFLKQLIEYLLGYNPNLKIIWDPIFKTSSGFDFNLNDVTKSELIELIKKIEILTPNKFEFENLKKIIDFEEDSDLLSLTNFAITGGLSTAEEDSEIENDPYKKVEIINRIYYKSEVIEQKQEIYPIQSKHGSGCNFSTKLAIQLAQGHPIKDFLKENGTNYFFKSTTNKLGIHFQYSNNIDLNQLYYITPEITNYKNQDDFYNLIKAVLDGGCKIIQVRQKKLSKPDLSNVAIKIKSMINDEVKLIINDHPDVAIECGADGVHLGKNDESPLEARAKYGNGLIIGRTINSVEEMKSFKILSNEVDYFGIGPLNETKTKDNAVHPLGFDGVLDILKHIPLNNQLIPIPVVLVGGITPLDIENLLNERQKNSIYNKINTVAISGSISMATNPKKQTEKIINLINKMNIKC